MAETCQCARRKSRSEFSGQAMSSHTPRTLRRGFNWEGDELAIPLSQLEVIDADDETREAVEDWLYRS